MSQTPYQNTEEAFFAFINAQRYEGAKREAGANPRPGGPLDVLAAIERLYRNRQLTMDHILVLRHYGKRNLAPDPRHVKEARAAALWKEALDALETVLVRKGIVSPPSIKPFAVVD